MGKTGETFRFRWTVYVHLADADCGFYETVWRDTADGAEGFVRRMYPSATIVLASSY